MVIKLDEVVAIDAGRCESIIFRVEGSEENAWLIKVDEQGVGTIEGPMNLNKRTFQFRTSGLKEATSEEKLNKEVVAEEIAADWQLLTNPPPK